MEFQTFGRWRSILSWWNKRKKPARYVVGIDVGTAGDQTAIVVVERMLAQSPGKEPAWFSTAVSISTGVGVDEFGNIVAVLPEIKDG